MKNIRNGTESDSSASSDVDFDDYGEFGYQLEPEYTEEELRQMEEAASAQRRGNREQSTSERHKFDIH
jgi:hypothetical protein